MKILNNFRYYGQTSIVAFGTLILGIYAALHINYLDSPKITPDLPPNPLREIMGFTDDWWFATLLIVVSALLMIGIAFDKMKLIVATMAVLSGIYATIAIEFTLRGVLSPHYNITWVTALMAELFILSVMGKLGKGGGHHQK